MRGDFFNGGIYFTKQLAKNPYKVANCLTITFNLRPRYDLLKSYFYPKYCMLRIKALTWESRDLTLGPGKLQKVMVNRTGTGITLLGFISCQHFGQMA